jgi:CRISPR-associated protein Cas1
VRVGLGLPTSELDLTRASDLDTLRGLEGAAAAAYWAAFARALPPLWSFPGRRRRPAPDPVNALLSLGYTLLIAPASALLHEAGLDPQLGFLHGESRERPALALDLIEAARPLVDAFVRQLLVSRELLPEHFHVEAGESRLTVEGRRVFYPRWYATAEAWRVPMAALLRAWRTRLLPAERDLD